MRAASIPRTAGALAEAIDQHRSVIEANSGWAFTDREWQTARAAISAAALKKLAAIPGPASVDIRSAKLAWPLSAISEAIEPDWAIVAANYELTAAVDARREEIIRRSGFIPSDEEWDKCLAGIVTALVRHIPQLADGAEISLGDFAGITLKRGKPIKSRKEIRVTRADGTDSTATITEYA